MNPLREHSRLASVRRSTSATTALILSLLGSGLLVAAAQAQSTFYRPLTLAPADEPASGGGSAAPAEAGSAATAHAPGEEHHGKSADEIAKELANPNNSIAKLAFKNQFRVYTGDLPGADDQWNYSLLFQPIFPFNLGETSGGAKQVLFVRPAIPLLVEQPVPKLRNGNFEWDDTTALGDIGFDLAYGQTMKNGIIWLAGMAGTLPTATDSDVAGKQLRLGPELVLAKAVSKHFLLGVFPSHQWDVAGWADSYYSTTSIQPLAILTPGGGWQIAYKPTMSYDWRADQWTVPVGLSVAKTVVLSGKPWQFELEVNYYVEQADAFGPKWMIGFNATPLVNNFIASLIQGKK